MNEQAYEQYKLWWLRQHEISLTDIVRSLDKTRKEMIPGTELEDTFKYWEKRNRDKIWLSKEQFLTDIFPNENLMKQILSDSQYQKYLEENLYGKHKNYQCQKIQQIICSS